MSPYYVGDWEMSVNKKVAIIKVRGMHCEGCAKSIESALRLLDGVYSASVEFNKRRAIVEYNPEITDVDKLRQAITDAGYDA